MPQSRTRKAADQKKKVATKRKTAERQAENEAEREATTPTAAERRRAERRAELAERKAEAEKKSKKSGDTSGQDDPKPAKKSASRDTTRRRTTAERRGAVAKKSSEPATRRLPASRRWVAPTFVAAFVLGALWLVVYYIVSYYPEASAILPFMMQLGNWNILIGMGMMAVSFIIATQWK